MLALAHQERQSLYYNAPPSSSERVLTYIDDVKTYDKQMVTQGTRELASWATFKDSSLLHFYQEFTTFATTEEEARLSQLFSDITKRWKEETEYYSSVERIVENRYHQSIVKMGRKVLRYILNDLRNNGGFWFVALVQITGTNVITPEIAGDIDKMKNAWLEWGREQGIY